MQQQRTRESSSARTGPPRNRSFRLLWSGNIASASGVAAGAAVITYALYATTHSALWIAALGVVEFVPTLAIGVFSGALVDRYDRRRLMVASDAARAASFATLAGYVALVGFDPLVVLAVIFAVACFATVFGPASRALLPTVLPAADLTEGNGLMQAGWTAAAFVGSPFGGFLVVAVGVVSGLVYNALTYAVSALLIASISIVATAKRARTEEPARPPSLFSEVAAGFRFLRSQSALLTITVAATAANFFGSMYLAFIVVYNVTILHGSATVFGALLGAETLGFGLGSFLTARLGTDRAPGVWSAAGWGLAGLPMVTVVYLPFVPAVAVLMAAQQFLSAVGNTTWMTAVQRTVPDEYLGRYFAIDEAGSFAMIPLGILVGGFLIVAFGTGPVFVLAGVGTALSGASLVAARQVRQWGTRAGAAPSS